MKENNDISAFDNIFRQQLENASATPPAGVWEGISSSVAASTSTSVTTTAIVKTALWVKIGIGVVAAAAISAVVYIATDKKEEASAKSVAANPQIVREQIDNEAAVTIEPSEHQSELKPVESVKQPAGKANTAIRQWEFDDEWKTDVNKKDLQVEQEKPVVFDSKGTEPVPGVDKNAIKSADNPVKVETKSEVVNKPAESKSEIPVKNQDNNIKYEDPIIPNAFTSNGDGFNDTYLIDIKGEESVRIIIFDIKMNIVFETDNKTEGWNAVKPNGEEYPAGSYIVKVIYKFPGSQEKIKTDVVKLIR